MAKGQADRFGEPRLDPFADHNAIDDRLDRMGLLWRKLWRLVDFQQIAIDPRPHEPGLADLLERLAVLPLAAADDRRENHHPRAGRLGQDRRNDLFRRLRADGHAALVAARFAQAGEKQPQVIINLGDRSDRAAGIVAAGPLVDGDCRLQSLDQINVGPFELIKELPGVRREAFDILPLPFGVDRIESQRTFAGPARAGEDYQPVVRQSDIDILQIVRPRAVYADTIDGSPQTVVGVANRSPPLQAFVRTAGFLLMHGIGRKVWIHSALNHRHPFAVADKRLKDRDDAEHQYEDDRNEKDERFWMAENFQPSRI